MENIGIWLAAIPGFISLIGLVYFVGIWRGGVDSDRKYFRDCIKKYPPAEMWTMLQTLWKVYVVEALHNRPDLVTHHSAFKLNKKGEDLIPDQIKKELDEISDNPGIKEEIATGYLVVKNIGIERITSMADETKLSLQEAVAVLSAYLSNRLYDQQ